MSSHTQVVVAAPDRHDVILGSATMGLRERVGQPVNAVEDAVRPVILLAVDEMLEVCLVVEAAQAVACLSGETLLEQARRAEVLVSRHGE